MRRLVSQRILGEPHRWPLAGGEVARAGRSPRPTRLRRRSMSCSHGRCENDEPETLMLLEDQLWKQELRHAQDERGPPRYSEPQ
jgi:hypothetical protein